MVSATGKPSSLVVCYLDGTFSLQIANTTGNTMSGATLLLDLPSGARYSPGSVAGATENNISNLNQPVFDLPDIPNNTAAVVSYNASLSCGYTNTENFNYIVTYNLMQYSGYDTPLQNYYYPEPVITNITNSSAVIPVNSTVTRDITIEQQGLNSTLDTLILYDEHTSDIDVISVSLGTLHPYVGPGPLEVDTVILTGSNFPGGNNMFDAGESIIVSETVRLMGCNTGQSTLKAAWGCFGQTCSYYSSFPSVSPAAGTTIIAMAFTNNNHGWGFIDNSGWVEMSVTNNGTGAGTAFDLAVLCGFSSGGSTYYPNADWVNEIDSFSVNGNYLQSQYNYAAGALNGQYAYYMKFRYTSDPDGPGVGLDDVDLDGYYDDLPVGKTVILKAHTYYNWPEAVSKFATGKNCGYGWTNSAWQAFRYGYDYKDQCQGQFGVNWIPNGNLLMFQTYNTITIQHTIPPDLYDGVPVWMDQLVTTSTSVNNEGCPNDSVHYKLVLPSGISIGPGTATFKGVSMGTPLIIGDSVFYKLDKSKILTGGTFHVPLVANCSGPHATTGFVHTELKFWCDRLSYLNRYFTYWCSNSPIFGIQCPVTNCPNPSVSLFSVKRTTLGWTNNHLAARVTPGTPGLRLDNAMARDSIRIVVAGRLNGPVDSLYCELKHDALPGGWGNQLFFDILCDTLYFYDIETATWHICGGLSPQVRNGTTSYVDTYFGNLTLPGNCLSGISFTNGDSLVYVIRGRVKNIAQTEWRTVPAFRAHFLWKDTGLDKYCNDLGVTFNVLGSNYKFYATTFYQQIVLQGCTSFLYEGLIYQSMESCGGDIAFPNEIRPFLALDTLTFTLPEGFAYLAGSSQHTFNQDNTSAYGTEVIPDPIITVGPAGTKLIYIRTPSWSYSDYYDCSSDLDRITFTATPSCKATGNYNYVIDAKGRYQFCTDGIGLKYNSVATKSITYTAPLMDYTALITTAEGTEDTVYWEVRLCNQRSFSSNNNWLGFESADQGINVVKVTDITIPAAPVNIPIAFYGPGKKWAQLGSFANSACKYYLVKATYSRCDFDSILVRHGYNCAGYPMNPELGYPPSGYGCTENQGYLYIDPKMVSLNVALTEPSMPVDLCDTLDLEAEVTNSQLSYGYELKLMVTIPPGLGIMPGQSKIKFPYTTGTYRPLQDPVNLPVGSNKWVYDISNDPNGVAILKGVDSIPKNGYRLKFRFLTDCNFISGTNLKITALAANACGDIDSRISYTQPILINDLPTNTNLYVISTLSSDAFFTCDGNSPVRVKVVNLGPTNVSNIEKLGITIDDAYDYVPGSLVDIHNGPSGVVSNTITGGLRYIRFGIQPNLDVNDSIVFTFDLYDVDPGSLTCDTLPMETSTLLVGKVYCSLIPGDSCVIQSITATVTSERPVIKDKAGFGSWRASSVPSGTTGETVTVTYTLKNTGTDTLRTDTLHVVFFHDANGNGIADESAADSLYSQPVTCTDLLAGDSVTATAVFYVPSGMVCKLLAALRPQDNVCTCGDAVISINTIPFKNAGPDTTACADVPVQIGTPGITGYTYFWVPASYLGSNTVSDPIFTYNNILTQPDTLTYFLFTTRAGNCLSSDTMKIVVFPQSSAYAGRDTTLCEGSSYTLLNSIATNPDSLHWSTSGNGTFNDPRILHPTYQPGPGDIASGSVTLTLTVFGHCGAPADDLSLFLLKEAASFAGNDTVICTTGNYLASEAIASDYSALNWTTTGDGSFSNPGLLHPVYTPGPSDIATGSVHLILMAAGIPPCPSHSDTMLLTLHAPPAVTNNPLQETICSNQSTSITLTADQPGTTFTWTAAVTSGVVTGYSNGSGPLINQVLVNAQTTPGSVTYTIVPDNQGCTGQPAAFLVIVNPIPVVTNNPPASSLCSGGTTNIVLQSNMPGTTFTWTANGSSGNVTGFGPGSGNVISQTLVNLDFSTETVTYHITPSASGCTGGIFDYTVTVKPIPDVYFNPAAQTICGGTGCNIQILSHVAGATFTWTASGSSPNVTGYSPGSGNLIHQTLTNLGYLTETVTYTVVPLANGCAGNSGNVVITVNPLPPVTYTPCHDLVTTLAAKPIRLKGGTPLGGTYSGAGVNSPTGIFYPALAGPGSHPITYSYTNVFSCSAAASLTLTVVVPPPFFCGGNLTDVRDNKIYPTVDLGTQCWMAVNLDYGMVIASSQMQWDNCSNEKYCYNDNPLQCAVNGGLYQWDELMQFVSTPGVQGLCPPGWHIPSENDWNILFAFYINNGFAGSPLKYTGYSGFNALLSGSRLVNNAWDFQGFATLLWSSTAYGPYKAWAHGMNDPDPSVSRYPSYRVNAFSVRCIKD
ncbi:MAG TPA: PKD-like domain-containing protein [Bacteroidales bacterium]|nr:PKD-like domain-containing protein [Bacteroidales bacterium]